MTSFRLFPFSLHSLNRNQYLQNGCIYLNENHNKVFISEIQLLFIRTKQNYILFNVPKNSVETMCQFQLIQGKDSEKEREGERKSYFENG